MDRMMGALFFRGATPSEIEAMGFRRLAYWYEWHKVMEKAEANPPGSEHA